MRDNALDLKCFIVKLRHLRQSRSLSWISPAFGHRQRSRKIDDETCYVSSLSKVWHRKDKTLSWNTVRLVWFFYVSRVLSPWNVLSEQTNESAFLCRILRGIFFFVPTWRLPHPVHPCENHISATLRIPLCRLYGLTEVGYRVLVPGPDPTRACILCLSPLSNTRDKHSLQPPWSYRGFDIVCLWWN